MYKIIVLTAIFLFIACPVWAVDIDQINKDWHEQAGIEPIQTEPVEPVHKYNFWKGQFDPWTKEDTYLQLCVSSLQLADWKMTIVTAENPDKYCEDNPTLPKQPTVKDVNQYFVIVMLVHPIVSYTLPTKLRRLWQLSSILAEIYCVNNCYKAGIRIKF